jgi:hypothetical protein
MFPAVPQFEMKFGKGFPSTEYQSRKFQNRKNRAQKKGTLKEVILAF